ncbi:hypothetical protein Taro_020538 [Colocasia esculenta]|uniref:C2H2-type domain-containing protein n=1 Tax=Colocasia esculenta TaxID=4460 RepID=A0A843UWH1_COLES|nr:hypothetical protein [Colocasia esculenta]
MRALRTSMHSPPNTIALLQTTAHQPPAAASSHNTTTRGKRGGEAPRVIPAIRTNRREGLARERLIRGGGQRQGPRAVHSCDHFHYFLPLSSLMAGKFESVTPTRHGAFTEGQRWPGSAPLAAWEAQADRVPLLLPLPPLPPPSPCFLAASAVSRAPSDLTALTSSRCPMFPNLSCVIALDPHARLSTTHDGSRHPLLARFHPPTLISVLTSGDGPFGARRALGAFWTFALVRNSRCRNLRAADVCAGGSCNAGNLTALTSGRGGGSCREWIINRGKPVKPPHRDRPRIISSNQQFAHFDPPNNCYNLQNEQSFPEFAPDLNPGSQHAYLTDKGQSSSEMNWGNHVNPTSVNSTTMGCDPRAMLSNLSFLEQKIHQVQDIVRSIMNQEGQICNQPNELAAQQQLVTADLTSIIIQLITTAGTLLPSINGALLSTNSSVEQLGSVIGSSTSLLGLNVNMEQSVVFTSEETKTPEHEGQIKGMSNYGVEERSPVEEHDGKDLEDGGEIENLPPGSYEVLQLEKEEILAPHTHFCSICGKGFKRDANLRMHMRGHGDEYKTAAALAKPSKDQNSEPVLIKRYSCPFVGCKRNKEHKKFQPLKTILCVKNHYKRSHCDKSYICSRCNSKKFSVIADLKTHEKHCGRDKWICSCGTTFSRKDKLFGHVSLFQGHTPALPLEETKVPGTSDQGQINGAMTNMGNTELSFSGSGDDIDVLDIKVLDNDANFFSPVNFDSYNLGGLNDFPRPAFEVSESSFSFFPSMSSNYVRKSGENLNSSVVTGTCSARIAQSC